MTFTQSVQFFTLSQSTAHANLAYEEWLFSNFHEDLLRLWVNPTSVIIGKHQTAVAEANVQFCVLHDVPIIRRISGGGTVYHDPGNVNFSFFRNVDPNDPIDYESNLRIIQKALQSLGYPVELNARHDLILEGMKISGNAQHIKKKRALHHGTLLYDADIEMLRRSIKRSSGSVEHRAVASVRSKSRNLREYLDLGETSDFVMKLEQALKDSMEQCSIVPMPSKQELDEMVNDRYRTEAWNYGYGPKYVLKSQLEIDGRLQEFELQVDRGGNISALTGHQFRELETLKVALIDSNHFPEELKERIHQMGLTTVNALELF